MSCIVGIIDLDGAPVDRKLLEEMTYSMKDRAPDEIGVWCSGNIGFGHAMLRISPESKNEHQPSSLDGEVWISADARIDGREELIRQLRSAGKHVQADVPDVELILYAYSAFGDTFLDHLIGDFAFALWDERHKKLICARDHFGVRPFFYAKTDRVFIFASDIDALLKHPAVSRTLDEGFIADFLLFGFCMESGLTVYRDIHRLPMASQLVVTSDGFNTRRYWSPPNANYLPYKNNSDYADQFEELFGLAVNDRIRAKSVALELSGGMDSTSIAAVAASGIKAGDGALTAYSITCNGLLPEDQEGHFAEMVASYLGVPVVFQASEDHALFDRFATPELRSAEPFPNPDLSMHYDKLERITRSGARVLLSGQGGDMVFSGSSTYYADLLRSGHFLKFATDVYRYVCHTGTFAGMGLRSALFGSKRQLSWRPPFPTWIDLDFARRAQLQDRWQTGWHAWNGISDLRHQVQRPWLSHGLESYEVLRMPVVARHPFFDLRLVTFMLSLPNKEASGKNLLRKAMRGRLPEPVRTRPKKALVGDHFRVRLSNGHWENRVRSRFAPGKNIYIDSEEYILAFNKYLAGHGQESTWSSWLVMNPIALDYWLQDTFR